MSDEKPDLSKKPIDELRDLLQKRKDELKKLLEGKGQDLKKGKAKAKRRKIKLNKTKKSKARDKKKTTNPDNNTGVKFKSMGSDAQLKDIKATREGIAGKSGRKSSSKGSKTGPYAEKVSGCAPEHEGSMLKSKKRMKAIKKANAAILAEEPTTSNYHASVAINLCWVWRRYTFFGIHPEYLRHKMMGKDYLMPPHAMAYRFIAEISQGEGFHTKPGQEKWLKRQLEDIPDAMKTYYKGDDGTEWSKWLSQANISQDILKKYGQVLIKKGDFWDFRRVNQGAYNEASYDYNKNIGEWTTKPQGNKTVSPDHQVLSYYNTSGQGGDDEIGFADKSFKGNFDIKFADPNSGKPGQTNGQSIQAKREECVFYATHGRSRDGSKMIRAGWGQKGVGANSTAPNGIICEYGITSFNWGKFGPQAWLRDLSSKRQLAKLKSPSDWPGGARQAKIDWIKKSIWVGYAMGATSKDPVKAGKANSYQTPRHFHVNRKKCNDKKGIYQYDSRRWLARNLAVWETIHEYMESHYGEVVVSCSSGGGWQPNHGSGCYGKDNFGRSSNHARGNASDFQVKVLNNKYGKPLWPHTTIIRMKHTKVGTKGKTEWDMIPNSVKRAVLGQSKSGGMVHPWIVICAVMKLIRGGLLPNMAVGHYCKVYQGARGTSPPYDKWVGSYKGINDGVLRTSDKPHLDTMNISTHKPVAEYRLEGKTPKDYNQQGDPKENSNGGIRTTKWVWLGYATDELDAKGRKKVEYWKSSGGSKSWIPSDWYKDDMIDKDNRGYVGIKGGIRAFDSYPTPKLIEEKTGIKNHWLFHLEQDFDTSIETHMKRYEQRIKKRLSDAGAYSMRREGFAPQGRNRSNVSIYRTERWFQQDPSITDVSRYIHWWAKEGGDGWIPSFWNFYWMPFWPGGDEMQIPFYRNHRRHKSRYGYYGY